MKPISTIKRARMLFGGQRSLESKNDDGTICVQRVFTIYRLKSGKWYHRKRDLLDEIKDGGGLGPLLASGWEYQDATTLNVSLRNGIKFF